MQHSTYRLTNLLKHNSVFIHIAETLVPFYCMETADTVKSFQHFYYKPILKYYCSENIAIFWVMTEYRNNMNLHVVYICKGTVHIDIKWCFWRIRFNSTCKAFLWKCGCPSSKRITLPLHVRYVWNGDMVKECLLSELPWNFWFFSNSISSVLPDCMHIRKNVSEGLSAAFFVLTTKANTKRQNHYLTTNPENT